MFGRAKAKAREAANKLREFEQNHQLGERVKAAAESVASAVEEKAQAFADIASEVIAGTEETGPSLGVVLVAVADEAECEAIARLVRGSHSGFTSAGRWEVVKSATLADAKAVLDQPLQRLAAVITRVDLPEVAPPPRRCQTGPGHDAPSVPPRRGPGGGAQQWAAAAGGGRGTRRGVAHATDCRGAGGGARARGLVPQPGWGRCAMRGADAVDDGPPPPRDGRRWDGVL
eukprot:COSAG01_NODE_293_length_19376_cov_41.772060_11_plen_230_part_00